jgi:FKBP-type peptidyl-prolyl cis-trans isomerase 2
MKIGESKQLSVAAADGCGEPDGSLFQTAPASALPEDAREVGIESLSQPPPGEQRPLACAR